MLRSRALTLNGKQQLASSRHISVKEVFFILRTCYLNSVHWLLGRLKATKNYFCRSCRDEEEEETVEHLICFCPALCRLRLKHLGKPFIHDLTEISEINPKNISAFIKSSGWKTC